MPARCSGAGLEGVSEADGGTVERGTAIMSTLPATEAASDPQEAGTLARELAALRLAVGEVATRDYLRRELEELREMVATLLAANDAEGRPMRTG